MLEQISGFQNKLPPAEVEPTQHRLGMEEGGSHTGSGNLLEETSNGRSGLDWIGLDGMGRDWISTLRLRASRKANHNRLSKLPN